MGGHHAEGLHPQGQEQDGGEEEDALTARGQEGGLTLEAQALVELVDVGREGHDGHDRPREPDVADADVGHLGVVAEPPHDGLGEKDGHRGEKDADDRAYPRGEGKGLPGAATVPRSVVVAHHGLEALAEADDDVAYQDVDLPRDGDGRARRVAAVGDGLDVQHRRRHAPQALTADGGESRGHDEAVIGKGTADVAQADADDGSPRQEDDQQDEEADGLADDGGQRRTSRLHTEAEDEDGVEDDVKDTARADPHGGQRGVALAPQGVAEDEGGAADGGADEDEASIGDGVGHHGVGTAQQAQEGLEHRKPQYGDDTAHQDGGKEGAGGVPRGGLVLLGTQLTADETARAHAQTEADGLDDRHDGIDRPHGGRGGLIDLGDEVGVGSVVDHGDEHTDHRGDGQGGHQTGNGGIHHAAVLGFGGGGGYRFGGHGIIFFL